jgi:undecaprenyl-diphosphatase
VAVVATVLVLLLWPILSGPARRVATALAVLVAVVVGVDRIFLGVHFPSDVAAGWILGAGITFSSWLGFIGRTSATSSSGPSHPA